LQVIHKPNNGITRVANEHRISPLLNFAPHPQQSMTAYTFKHLVMQPPLHRTRHNETRISQALHQMVCAHTGQEHVGFARKTPTCGNKLAKDFCDLGVRELFMRRQEEHRTSLQLHPQCDGLPY
jgi:hypothetical protein